MSNLSQILADSNWGQESARINQNFQNINTDLEKVKSATTKFKGYFTTEESLKNKFGSPKIGDTAWVGESYPGTVYDVQTDGQWHNTGKAPDTGSVDLQDYAKKEELTELEGKGDNRNSLISYGATFFQSYEKPIDELSNVYIDKNGVQKSMQGVKLEIFKVNKGDIIQFDSLGASIGKNYSLFGFYEEYPAIGANPIYTDYSMNSNSQYSVFVSVSPINGYVVIPYFQQYYEYRVSINPYGIDSNTLLQYKLNSGAIPFCPAKLAKSVNGYYDTKGNFISNGNFKTDFYEVKKDYHYKIIAPIGLSKTIIPFVFLDDISNTNAIEFSSIPTTHSVEYSINYSAKKDGYIGVFNGGTYQVCKVYEMNGGNGIIEIIQKNISYNEKKKNVGKIDGYYINKDGVFIEQSRYKIYYFQVKKHEFLKIKKNINISTAISNFSFFEDIPNVGTQPYYYERSMVNDFENVYIISPINGYIAVSYDSSYGTLDVMCHNDNSDIAFELLKGFKFNTLLELSVINNYYINKNGQFVQAQGQDVVYTKVEKGQIVKFEFDNIQLGTNFAKWAIYTSIPNQNSTPYAYEPVYKQSGDNVYIYCPCSGYLATTRNLSYGDVYFYSIKENKQISETDNFIINCHGDSLTEAGKYESEIKRLCNETYPNINVTVNNHGASGAAAGSILAAFGSVPIMITEEFTLNNGYAEISAICVDKDIKGQAFFNYGSNESGAGISPVVIDGIKGTLDKPEILNSVESDEGQQIAVVYKFHANDETSNAKLASKSIIYPYNVQQRQGDITILYMGTNNMMQYESVKQGVIDMLKKATQYVRNGKYIVVGLHAERNDYGNRTTIDDINTYNDMARKEFGLKFVDTLSYMIVHGLTDVGIEPTEADTQAISEGKCPPSLIPDGIHWSNDAYKVVGKLIFNRMKDLGYFVI